MAGHRKDMLDIQRIIQLKARGESNRSVARLLGINRKTVNEYVLNLAGSSKDFGELSRLDEESLTSILPEPKAFNKPQAYQDLQALVPIYQKALKQSGFTYLAIWEDYRKKYPDGYGYTQFKEHIQKAFAVQHASFHMEQIMGEKLLIDYAGDRLLLTDRQTGATRPAELFIAVLAGSGYTYVEASENQQKASFLNSVRRSLEFTRGVPKLQEGNTSDPEQIRGEITEQGENPLRVDILLPNAVETIASIQDWYQLADSETKRYSWFPVK